MDRFPAKMAQSRPYRDMRKLIFYIHFVQNSIALLVVTWPPGSVDPAGLLRANYCFRNFIQTNRILCCFIMLHHGSPEPRQRWPSHAPIETCASFFFTFILNRISMRFLSSPGRRDRWILWGFSH